MGTNSKVEQKAFTVNKITNTEMKKVPVPVIPRGWNSPTLREVTIDEEKDSIALSLEVPGHKRVLAVFYMNDDWGKVKLAQLMKTMEIELIEGEELGINELKEVFDEFVGQPINYVCFKHRKVTGARGGQQILAAYWFSAQTKHDFDQNKSFVDETSGRNNRK